MTIAHRILGDYGTSYNGLTLAFVHPASKQSIKKVLNAEQGDDDGRSEYCWLRLPNGDLMLGVFPRGDTYLAVEEDAVFPGEEVAIGEDNQ